jgi:hypothetical protein
MHLLIFILYLAALVSFLIAAFRPVSRIGLVPLGLAFFVIPALLGSAGVTL